MTNSELLAEIAEDFTARLRGEDPPSIDSYVEQHPDLEPDIRKLFPSILAIEQLSHREETERKFERTTRRLAIAPDGLLGDFKIIRELGRGGMGVVYEAENQSLKRRVALKILGPTMAGSAKQLARFKSESKAVAKLHHTNIVSVFGVGEHEGLYYYAMNFIDGMTLAEAIAIAKPTGSFLTQTDEPKTTDDALTPQFSVAVDQPSTVADTDTTSDRSAVKNSTTQPVQKTSSAGQHTPSRWEEIARLGVCIADALEHAHANGVWHRDIKPSNLIFDQSNKIWITDFGLARFEDRDDVTATGDIVGTPRYMAPEQFEGKFDGRCDTYGLGITLYEMLTLQPAFKTMGPQLIKQKTTSQPPQPRSINPAIPQDLETIVLKACEVDPAKRYKTPGAMAEDLELFLADRPIRARRVTARERVYRWSRRNPLSAALVLLSTMLLAGLFTVSAIWNVQMRGIVRELNLQTGLAQTQQRKSDARARRSRKLVEDFQENGRRQMARIQNRRFPEPVASELDAVTHVSMGGLGQSDREYVADQLSFNLNMASDHKDVVELEVEAAYALTKAGQIHQMLGEFESAADCYVDALKRFTNLEVARRARRLNVEYDRTRMQKMGIDFLTELVLLHTKIDEVRPYVDAADIPEGVGSTVALRLLDEDPGNILDTSARCNFAYVEVLHSRHITMLKKKGWLQLIGKPVKKRGDFTAEIAENETAINIVQLLLTKDRTNRDYRMLGIRIQTDRGRLELLRGNAADATIHLGNAARALGEWLIAQEAAEIQSTLQAELAYVLCLAPQPIGSVDVTADNITKSLSGFANRMNRLASRNKRAKRASELARAAEKRLAEYAALKN
jgi:serine/threonine protein kinase